MLEKELIGLEETCCENPKVNDLYHFSASIVQGIHHRAKLLVPLLTRLLNEIFFFN